MDRQREEGRNDFLVKNLQQRYAIQGFPTLLVEGAGQKELTRMLGYRGKTETMKQLREVTKN